MPSYGVEIDGTFKDQSEISFLEIDEDFEDQVSARIVVERGIAGNVDAWDKSSEVYIKDDASTSNDDARFGGLIHEIDNSGSTVEIICETFERYGRNGAPSPPGLQATDIANSDDEIVEYALERTDKLTAGTLEEVGGSSDFLFSHSSPASIIRKTARATGAIVWYNPDKSVDYLNESSMRRDRTDITISPSNQNIFDSFDVERENTGADTTHLRAIGAGEGPHQVQVNVIPANDSGPDWLDGSYEESDEFQNVVRYDSNRWESGDERKWDAKSNKDITDESVMEELAREKIKDIDSDEKIEIATGIIGVSDVRLGDVFTVTNDRENVYDKELTVVELTTTMSSDGIEYEAVLSNRRMAREDGDKENRRDLDRFNKNIEGNAVPINASGGRQPVGPNHNYQMKLYYPDEVEYEHRLNIRVMGLPYRAYSAGAAASSGVVDNQIPYDLTTSAGFEGTIGDSFRYPAIGEAEQSPDSVIYEDQSDDEQWQYQEIDNFGTAFQSVEFDSESESEYLALNGAVQLYENPPTFTSTVASAWVTQQRYPVADFSNAELEFSMETFNVPNGSTVETRLQVVETRGDGVENVVREGRWQQPISHSDSELLQLGQVTNDTSTIDDESNLTQLSNPYYFRVVLIIHWMEQGGLESFSEEGETFGGGLRMHQLELV